MYAETKSSLKTVLVGMSCELGMRSDVLRNDVINYVIVTEVVIASLNL